MREAPLTFVRGIGMIQYLNFNTAMEGLSILRSNSYDIINK